MGSVPSASSTTSSHSQTRQRRRATRSTGAALLERTGMCAFSHYAIGGNKRDGQTFLCDDFAGKITEPGGCLSALAWWQHSWIARRMPAARERPVMCPACGSSRIGPFLPRGGNEVEYRCRDCGQRWTVRIAPTRSETAMRVAAATGTPGSRPAQPPCQAQIRVPNGELIPFTPKRLRGKPGGSSPTVPE